MAGARSWVVVDGEHNEESFLQSAEKRRLAESSTSEIGRFYTAGDHLFHVDGKTFALTKMWGRGFIPTIEDIIMKAHLERVTFKPTDSGDE